MSSLIAEIQKLAPGAKNGQHVKGAYAEGQHAKLVGMAPDANPYRDTPATAKRWDDGYADLEIPAFLRRQPTPDGSLPPLDLKPVFPDAVKPAPRPVSSFTSVKTTEPTRVKPTKSAPAPKPVKLDGDYVTIGDLAASLGIDPKDARQALRKANHPKPTIGRWEWQATDPAIDVVKTIIATVKS